MTDWVSGGGVKIERAKEHLLNLDAELKAFGDREPYRPFSERNDERRQIVYRLRVLEELARAFDSSPSGDKRVTCSGMWELKLSARPRSGCVPVDGSEQALLVGHEMVAIDSGEARSRCT